MKPLPLATACLFCAGASAQADQVTPPGVPENSIASGFTADPARNAFAAYGVAYGLNYTGDVFDVTPGGISRGTSINGLLDVDTTVDLHKFIGWKNATFHVNAYGIHGKGPTTWHTGNPHLASRRAYREPASSRHCNWRRRHFRRAHNRQLLISKHPSSRHLASSRSLGYDACLCHMS